MMRFYYILHNNGIGHLLRTSRDSFWLPPTLPLPPKFWKRNGQYLLIFYVHFRGVCVVFLVLELKFSLKILIFTVTAVMLERGLLRAVA